MLIGLVYICVVVQAGAYTKYQLVWVLLGTVLIGLILQGMAARVGIVTGKHLSQLCRCVAENLIICQSNW